MVAAPPTGQRRFVQLFHSAPLPLDGGGHFGPITIAYESWGQLNPAGSNAVLLLHGFSGDSHAAGPAEPGHPTPGWWEGLIGPGLPLDTNRFHVICPNAFGSCLGSTGPASLAHDGHPYGSRFPTITIRDMVAAEIALADALGIQRWHAVIGGSMGAMRALEWAISRPAAVHRLLLMASSAYASAEQIGLHAAQIRAIELDPNFRGGNYYNHPGQGPWRGLSLARSIARISYGCERELAKQFDRRAETDQEPPHHGRYAVEADLEQQGEEFAQRFDANSYIALTRAMSHHDVGRGRGGVAAALALIQARTQVVSIQSDRLFPPRLQLEMARGISSGVTYTSIDSRNGHDGFLTEHSQLAPVLRQTLG
jgi:homoserine O-acetyltransferase